MSIYYISITVAVTACFVQVWGHFVYNRESGIYPNPTSWTLWGLTGFLEAWNYQDLSGDWVKNLLPYTCALCCAITWVICIFRSKFQFKRLKPQDWISLLLCSAALVIWRKFDLVVEANIVLQVDNVISFIPIIVSVWGDSEEEKPKAWMVWTVSYLLATATVMLRFEKVADLYYPVNCVLLHFIVGLLSLRAPAQRQKIA
ncbi:MAG: hypothetical protein Q8L64_04715 [bacterium]|nr:hypothetical protein [bacterium]